MRLPEQNLIDEALPDFMSDAVVRLNKCLYGLVQSPREFFKHFSAVLKKIGFTQSTMDPCLWLKHHLGKLIAAIAIFVDDAAIAAAEGEVANIKLALQQNFDMTDGGPISWFLGVRLNYDVAAGSMSLDQGAAISRLLSQFNMSDCSPVSTPIETRLTRDPTVMGQEERIFMQNKDYRGLVGSTLYLLFTRPDMTYAVNQLTRHVNDPRRAHWLAAMRVLKYLRGTINLALHYQREEEPAAGIIGYSDADWGGDTETRRSTTGFVFLLCGGAVSWKTKLQTSVALSTCEAELMALSDAAREAIWLRQLAIELQLPSSSEPVLINEDNQAALQLVRDQRFSERTKHVALRHFFAREQVAEGTIAVDYCSTERMVADIFTKPALRVLFERLCALLGLRQPANSKKGTGPKKQ